MGYRSEVKSVIYGTPDEMDAFKLAVFDLYNRVREEYGDEVKTLASDYRAFIYLDAPYTKWYDEYEEVQDWQQLLELAEEAGLNTEFVRVGESSEGDIEAEYYGDDNINYLEPMTKIDVGFAYDEHIKEVA